MRGTATTVKWQNGGFSVGGQKESAKGKTLGLTKAPTLNGVKDVGRAEVGDARAVVVNGADSEHLNVRLEGEEDHVFSGDSGTSSEADGSSESEDDGGHDRQVTRQEDKDHEMADESAEEGAEPSFGDLIQAQISQPIEVEAALADRDTRDNPREALKLSKPRSLGALDSLSLGTVMSQAIRTNDVTLLESCLHATDLGTIRSTIERLDSKLAAILLSKLAERLHRRPGRAGSLMVWVQWTLVSHGGYLASQPNSMKQLESLNKVIAERANALQPLLALKGKLDMLAAQSQLRRGMQSAAAAAQARDDEEEEGVIYVEGQEEDDDSEDQADAMAQTNTKQNHARAKTRDTTNLISSSSSNSDFDESDMPTTAANGALPLSDDESTSSSLIDDEASETDASSEEEEDDDAEVDHDDDDDGDENENEGGGNGNEDSEDAVQPPPAKRHAGMRGGGLFGRR
ncbi:hypothetical protein FGG08_001833 [Glutinoglossum americanum]|uniref:Small-subunit processome Utp12 domain-containing protein n=1 Tax=Glutinoglossum americanum TaxID=1670608 RepID=A0A9P8I638_9PEZI|nr:hypothetical protein FGG08_001833 [Glutinoglossum americanum]